MDDGHFYHYCELEVDTYVYNLQFLVFNESNEYVLQRRIYNFIQRSPSACSPLQKCYVVVQSCFLLNATFVSDIVEFSVDNFSELFEDTKARQIPPVPSRLSCVL